MIVRLFGFLFAAMFAVAAMAAEEHTRHDMSAMWKKSMARQQLSVGAIFDAHGMLWRAEVRDGFIKVSYSADTGETFSEPVNANPVPEAISANGETRPKIYVTASGALYLAWTQSLEVPFAGNVRFTHSEDGGRTFSMPVTINNNHDPITHRFEAMGVNAKGQVFLAWLDKREAVLAKLQGRPFSGISVYAAMSDDEGKSFHPDVKVADHTCECCRIAMAIDGSDTPVIAWRHIFGNNVRDHGMARLDNDLLTGKRKASEADVQRATDDEWEVAACPHHGPSLAFSGEVMHMTWFDNGRVRSGIFYAHTADGGMHFSTPLALGNADRQPSHPVVLSIGQDVYVAWKEFDGETSSIQAMHSTNGGKEWGKAWQVASTRDDAEHPLLLEKGTQAYLSWNTLLDGYRVIPLQESGK